MNTVPVNLEQDQVKTVIASTRKATLETLYANSEIIRLCGSGIEREWERERERERERKRERERVEFLIKKLPPKAVPRFSSNHALTHTHTHTQTHSYRVKRRTRPQDARTSEVHQAHSCSGVVNTVVKLQAKLQRLGQLAQLTYSGAASRSIMPKSSATTDPFLHTHTHIHPYSSKSTSYACTQAQRRESHFVLIPPFLSRTTTRPNPTASP